MNKIREAIKWATDKQVLHSYDMNKHLPPLLTLAEQYEKCGGMPKKIPYLDESITDVTIDNIRINAEIEIYNRTIDDCKFAVMKKLNGLEEVQLWCNSCQKKHSILEHFGMMEIRQYFVE